jgi:uncharacterized membrane protein
MNITQQSTDNHSSSPTEQQTCASDKTQLLILIATLVGSVACGVVTLYMRAGGWFVLPIVCGLAALLERRGRRVERQPIRVTTYKSLNPRKF